MKKLTRQATLQCFSIHAKTRCRQRGIPEEIAAIIVEYGSPTHTAGGAIIYRFDRNARNYADRSELIAMDKHRNSYAVSSADGQIMTIAHQKSGFRRKLH